MKKVLTAMTAVSLTLQANDNLNKEIDEQPIQQEQAMDAFLDELEQSPLLNERAHTNQNTLDASGTFLSFNKFVNLVDDVDGSGSVTAGDVLRYELSVNNPNQINASGAFVEDVPNVDHGILVNGSVTSTQGSILSGNVTGDQAVILDLGVIESFTTANVFYDVSLLPIPAGITREISNQALLTTAEVGFYLSDDPFVSGFTNPTNIFAIGDSIELYNEQNDGDLASYAGPPTVIEITTGVDRISGTVGGTAVDLEDCFQFTVPSNRRVVGISAESYVTTSGNFDSSLEIFSGLPPAKPSQGNIISTSISEFNVGANFLTFGFSNNILTKGIYSVCIIEGVPGQEYELLIWSDLKDPIFNNGFE